MSLGLVYLLNEVGKNSIFSFDFSVVQAGMSYCRIISFMHKICSKRHSPDVLAEIPWHVG